ncbi:MAG: nitroreductase family protein [Owenweeksia sp.]|nr:nitroreductase family protein [Owenweeksia sp.]
MKPFTPFNQNWAHTAPVIGVSLAAKKHDYKDRENVYHLHDLGMAMGGLLAQATHEGLHMHQMGGFDNDVIAKNFSINTADYAIGAMFALGYQDESRLEELGEKYQKSEREPRQRKNLNELVFSDGFHENPHWLK